MTDYTVYHILPEDDLKEHSEYSDEPCWCKPQIEIDGGRMVIVHNPLDGREPAPKWAREIPGLEN